MTELISLIIVFIGFGVYIYQRSIQSDKMEFDILSDRFN